jgi:hypothetical protein
MIKYEEPVEQVLVLFMQFSPMAPLKIQFTFQVAYVSLQGLHLLRFG